MPAGHSVRLLVKFSDQLQARADSEGNLMVSVPSGMEISALEGLSKNWGLRWRRVHSASDEKLSALEQRAARNTGREQPDLGGLLEVILPESTPDKVLQLASALQPLQQIEYADLVSADPPPPPAEDIQPTTPDLVFLQTYRGTDTGIGIDYVWETYGIRGNPELKISDCEYSYNTGHEDLQSLVSTQEGVASMYSFFGNSHGTAVLGILFGGDNGYGISGSVPACRGTFYPEYSKLSDGSTQYRSATIAQAVADSAPGDIVLLEMQTGAKTGTDYVPAEYAMSVWSIVKTATDAGVIVVAAAGNGAQNLDASSFADYRNRGDSGAILVGAADAARARSDFSTFGRRINLQGWGSGVASLGYGYYAKYGDDLNQAYTASFGGTSSAAPLVASAVALLQSVSMEKRGVRLTPGEVRNLLVSTGRLQTGDLSRPVGRLPNLVEATRALFSPVVIFEQPQGDRLLVGQPATLSVRAGSRFDLTYQWQKDGEDIPGATSDKFVIPKASPSDAGSYTVVVSCAEGEVASEGAGLWLADAKGRPYSFRPLQVLAQGGGTFTAGLNGRSLPIGASYTISATPSPGMIFKEWLKNGVSFSRNSKVSFAMEEGLVLEAVFVPNPYPAVAHFFNGLVGEGNLGSGGEADREAFFHENGFIQLTSLADGRFSGSLRLEGKSHSFSGKFDGFGEAFVSLKRPKRTPLEVELKFDTAPPGKISGTVTGTETALPFEALPGVYSGAKEDVHPLGGRRYTLLLADQEEAFGFAAIEILPNGTAKMAGNLPDGVPFTTTARLVSNEKGIWFLPWHLPLYREGAGLVFGELFFSESEQEPDVTGLAGWLSPFPAQGAGFLKSLAIFGERYQMEKGVSLLGGSSDSVPWQLTFDSPGKILSLPLVLGGSWPGSNVPVLEKPDGYRVAWSFYKTTGVIRGSLGPGAMENKASVPFAGVVFSHPVKLTDSDLLLDGGGFFTRAGAVGTMEVTSP